MQLPMHMRIPYRTPRHMYSIAKLLFLSISILVNRYALLKRHFLKITFSVDSILFA